MQELNTRTRARVNTHTHTAVSEGWIPIIVRMHVGADMRLGCVGGSGRGGGGGGRKECTTHTIWYDIALVCANFSDQSN